MLDHGHHLDLAGLRPGLRDEPGRPRKTTLTPAYLSYTQAFDSFEYGTGAAISFVLFAIIVLFTIVQRWLLEERGTA